MSLIENQINLLWTIAEKQKKVANAKITAGIFYKNRLITVGSNQYKTHPVAAEYGRNDQSIYLHAEVDCLIRVSKILTYRQLQKSTIIVVRCKSDLNKRNLYGLAKPCTGCRDCISDYGVGKIVYTLNGYQLKYTTEIMDNG